MESTNEMPVMKRHGNQKLFWLALLVAPLLHADERSLATVLEIDALDLIVVLEWSQNWDNPVDGVVVTDPKVLGSLMQLLRITPSETEMFPTFRSGLKMRSIILKSGGKLNELRIISRYLYSPVDGSSVSGDLLLDDPETQRRFIEIGEEYSKFLDHVLRREHIQEVP